ncbi:MAG: choline/carnitine O-acyltransferase [Alphaproteobacteria bacterium]|nr:choline/carnitine O-acyltransferase [Alphaproteobacteria bacterium]
MTATVKTFDLDATLPDLPVPRLEDTLARYLESVRPLVDDATFADVEAAAGELLEPGSVGRLLQQALEVRAALRDNWLSGWWEDVAYLSYPESLVINSSIGISTDARYAPGDQAMRAAQLTGGALDFYKAIVDQTLPPEVQRDGSGFDMSLLQRFYATTRYPGTDKDRIATFGGGQSRHIVVVRTHRFYAVEVIDESGNRLPDGDLMVQFRRIIAKADAAPPAPAVGVLTAARRPDWAAARDRLAASHRNRRTLDRIDRALFLVCLDDVLSPTFEDLARAGLYGQKGNRWHDKSFHLVIDPQGRFTLHGEHSPVDAGAWVPLIEAIGGPAEPLPEQAETSEPAPRELTWDLAPETEADIADAGVLFDNLTRDLDLRIENFTGFGKDLIKTFRTGPDPLLQMSFMLAYYRLYGRLPKTYEAASTRMFKGGRTETIRTASNEALAFVKAMEGSDYSASQKVELLQAAFAEHAKRGKEASAAQACDRHLLGLRLIAREAGLSELPGFFSQEIFTRGWELSTAQLPMQVGFVNHFGAVCPEGYGIGYIIKPDHININVTSFHSHPNTDSSRFLGEITRALHDMRAVLELVLRQAA